MKKATHEIEFPLGKTFWGLAKMYLEALSKRLEHLDIERHYSVLLIVEHEGKCSQQHICDQLLIDKVSMVRIIDLLIKTRYVQREVNPDDRREYHISLTAKSKKEMDSIRQAVQDINTAMLKGIPEAEKARLKDMLALMRHNLENLPSRDLNLPIVRD